MSWLLFRTINSTCQSENIQYWFKRVLYNHVIRWYCKIIAILVQKYYSQSLDADGGDRGRCDCIALACAYVWRLCVFVCVTRAPPLAALEGDRRAFVVPRDCTARTTFQHETTRTTRRSLVLVLFRGRLSYGYSDCTYTYSTFRYNAKTHTETGCCILLQSSRKSSPLLRNQTACAWRRNCRTADDWELCEFRGVTNMYYQILPRYNIRACTLQCRTCRFGHIVACSMCECHAHRRDARMGHTLTPK